MSEVETACSFRCDLLVVQRVKLSRIFVRSGVEILYGKVIQNT